MKNYRLKTALILGSILLCLLLPQAACLGATYYVDATDGSDINDGLSPSSAWESISKVNSMNFIPGDQILFKRGEVWVIKRNNAKLIIPSSGEPGNPITFGAYGEGDLPTLTSGEVITDWTGPDANGVYNHSETSWKNGLFEDGKHLKGASDPTLSDGNFYYDMVADLIYYKPTSGVPEGHTVVSVGTSAIAADGKSFITFKNIMVRYAHNGILFETSGGNIVVDGCNFNRLTGRGIVFDNLTDGNITVTNCTITEAADGIYFLTAGGPNSRVSNNNVSYLDYDGTWGWDGHAVGAQRTTNLIIEDNYFHHCKKAIALWSDDASAPCKDNIIRYNHIANSKGGTGYRTGYSERRDGAAIILSQNDANIVIGTQIYYNIIEDCVNGIYGRKSAALSPNQIYSNVIVNCGKGILLENDADYFEFKNNIFYNNSAHMYWHSYTELGTNNVADYNLYYPDGSNRFYFYYRLAIASNDFTGWQSDSNQDANSITQDPLFTDRANTDFRLQLNSPCIDKGIDVGLTRDFEGIPVPQGPTADIGAYEYTRTLLGDVSGNGEVSVYDASLSAMYAVGLITLTPEQIQAADVTGNSEVSSYDASLIAQYSIGLIEGF